jgi:glutamate formiminotransferase/formiminotetrahydrofolate cyclodeaminase
VKLLECIPNISEGRNEATIGAIASAISFVSGVKLLHTDTGYDANRTVFTFVGEPEAVLKAAFEMYKTAHQRIDMRQHQGTHPRQGAVDVCPFVPLGQTPMLEAIDIASRLAYMLETELNIPGYYYGYNATWPDHINLAYLRKGGYEALPQKFDDIPLDFGHKDNWEKSGVTVIGARKLLVAYNINLATKDVTIAKKIAGIIRQSGTIRLSSTGARLETPGRLAGVRAIGWYIKDFDRVQVSCNLTDLDLCGMLDVFTAVREEAEKWDTSVTGSELVGLAPLAEFEKAGQHFEPDANDPVAAAIRGLGLDEIKPFNAEAKILEKLLA